MRSNGNAALALRSIAEGLFEQLRNLGRFGPPAMAEGMDGFAQRVGFANMLFQALESHADLAFEEGEAVFSYHTLEWPEGLPPGGYSGDGDLRPSFLVPAYLGNWNLDSGAGTTPRILRSSAWIAHEEGLESAIRYVVACMRDGLVTNAASALTALSGLFHACDEVGEKDLGRFLFGESFDDSARSWLDADFVRELEPSHLGRGVQALAETCLQEIDRVRDSVDYDTWLGGAYVLERVISMCQHFLREFGAQESGPFRPVYDLVEEVRADTGPWTLPLAGEEGGSPAVRSRFDAVWGLVLLVQARSPEDWKRRIVDERLLVPHAIADLVLVETFRGAAGELPPEWSSVSPRLFPVYSRLALRQEGVDPVFQAGDDAPALMKLIEKSEQHPAEVVEPLTELVRRHPCSASVHRELAIALDRTDRTREALEHLVNALLVEPTDALLWQSLGVVLQRLGGEKEVLLARACQAMLESSANG